MARPRGSNRGAAANRGTRGRGRGRGGKAVSIQDPKRKGPVLSDSDSDDSDAPQNVQRVTTQPAFVKKDFKNIKKGPKLSDSSSDDSEDETSKRSSGKPAAPAASPESSGSDSESSSVRKRKRAQSSSPERDSDRRAGTHQSRARDRPHVVSYVDQNYNPADSEDSEESSSDKDSGSCSESSDGEGTNTSGLSQSEDEQSVHSGRNGSRSKKEDIYHCPPKTPGAHLPPRFDSERPVTPVPQEVPEDVGPPCAETYEPSVPYDDDPYEEGPPNTPGTFVEPPTPLMCVPMDLEIPPTPCPVNRKPNRSSQPYGDYQQSLPEHSDYDHMIESVPSVLQPMVEQEAVVEPASHAVVPKDFQDSYQRTGSPASYHTLLSPQDMKPPRAAPASSRQPKRSRMSSSPLAKEDNKLALYNAQMAGRSLSTPNTRRVDENGNPIVPGTIKSLKMVNIMSHAHFQKDWCPRYNFILGENGSGKSAILSAIVAGLGGKAFDTGRANSMRAIIRNGQSTARIEIVLNNPYTQRYGEDIKIVRTFSREGSSRYQIRDAQKKMRSLTRHELDFVLSSLNIQVDNPLAILHQEMSRNFLRTKDPSVLYHYFYRALLLGPCEALLKKASMQVAQAKRALETKDNMCSDMEAEVVKLEAEVKLLDSMQKVKERLKQMENVYFWALVKEQEEIKEKANADFVEAKNRAEMAHNEKLEMQSRVTAEEQSFGNSESECSQLHNTLTEAIREHETKRKERTGVSIQVRTSTGALKQIVQNLHRMQDQLRSLEGKVAEHNLNVVENTEIQRRAEEQRSAELAVQLNTSVSTELELNMLKTNKEFDLDATEGKMEKDKLANIRDLTRKLEDKKNELRSCRSVKDPKYHIYGKEMVKLMELVEQNRKKFLGPVYGPLGSCITVKEKKWAPLIEYALRGGLQDFAVSCNEDSSLLSSFIKRVYDPREGGRRNPGPRNQVKMPSVTKMEFGQRRHNVGQNMAFDGKNPTLLMQVDILGNNYHIYNWLVDIHSAERIILYETCEAACDVLAHKNRIPGLAMSGYSLDGYLTKPVPNYRTSVQWTYRGTLKILKISNDPSEQESLAQRIQGEINQLEFDLDRAQRTLMELRKIKAEKEKELQELKRKIMECRIEQNQIRAEQDKLKQATYNAPDIASWHEEINNLRQCIQKKTSEKEQCEREISENEAKLTQLGLEENAALLKAENLQKTQEKQSQKKSGAQYRIDQLKKELNKKDAAWTQMSRTVTELSKRLKEAEKLYQQKLKDATKRSPRVENIRGSSQDILKEQEALKQELKRNEKKVIHKDKIKKDYVAAKKAHYKVKEEIDIMKYLLMTLEPCIVSHQKMFVNKTNEYSIGVRTSFRNLIKNRGYDGDLVINNPAKTLVCYVSLDAQASAKAKRCLDLKDKMKSKKGISEYAGGMSGGERSFTTICFLTACWELMDMPFYILDEFDVFMDHLNRQTSQQILLDVGNKKTQAQFFIFTPLSMQGSVLPDDGIKPLVMRLKAPTRQLSTLPTDQDDDDSRDNRTLSVD